MHEQGNPGDSMTVREKAELHAADALSRQGVIYTGDIQQLLTEAFQAGYAAAPTVPAWGSPGALLIGEFEWDGSEEPDFILGTSHDAIRRAAVERLMYHKIAGEGPPRMRFDDRGWLAEHPFPPLDDPLLVHLWLPELADDDRTRPETGFDIWTFYTTV